MRITDNRYANERGQFELALRMIGHEARTRTIKECTNLSDDRIRKLYATYFRDGSAAAVKRRRGKSPQQVNHFVKNPLNRLQATTLISLYSASLLLRIDSRNRVHASWPRPDVEYGHRLCRAYETYLMLHPRPALSFEWAWNLLQNISCNDELFLSTCDQCRCPYIQDAYALDNRECPGCEIYAARIRGGAPSRDGRPALSPQIR